MAWDANRPVPWKRLLREAAIFLVLGTIVFALFVDSARAASYGGLVVGAALFVFFSALLAKFGYERQSLKAARASGAARRARAGSAAAAPVAAGRQRPAPTRRTSTGPSQRPNRSTKAKRR